MEGCNDHGCLVAKPVGMGTNGRCRCPEWKLHAVIKRTRNENERLREALDQIAESQDRGRYDGHPEPGPAYDEPYTPWLIARQALSADGEPVE